MIIVEISGLACNGVPNALANTKKEISHFLGRFESSDKRRFEVFFTSSALGVGGHWFMEDKIFVKIYYSEDEKAGINRESFSRIVFDEVREHIDSNLKSAIFIFIPVKKKDYIVFE